MSAISSLIRGEPDVVIRFTRLLMLIGVVLIFASVRLQVPGVIAGTFAMVLGAFGGSFVHWRHERGLWMLAGLLFLIFVTIYCLFVFGQLRDIVRGAPRPSIAGMIDFSLGTMILSANLRFFWRVGEHNWEYSQTSGERDPTCEKLSDDARAALELAEREAHRIKSGYFGTEHLLLGIIKLATSEAREELNRSDALTEILRDAPLTAVQQQLERVLIPAPPLAQQRSWIFWRKPKVVLHKTPRLRNALDNALEEARFWQQSEVGSVHLLLGLLRDDDNVAATVFANFGLKYSHVRRNAERIFQSDQ